MRYEKADCPRCDARNECFLSDEADRHLRGCPNCGCWYLVVERSDDVPGDVTGLRVEPLGDPPECPVEGCTETVARNRLPKHVIDLHGGSIEPTADGPY